MGSYRSKEDEVVKISTSVFVANFPDSFGAKNLWNTCKQYGRVVDAYIPYRRSKAGKRFGFVRFIKVLDVDRLVNNLCTVWVGRHKLQAIIPRFQREPLKRHSSLHNIDGVKRGNSGDTYNSNRVKGAANSYAHVVKGFQNSKKDSDSRPVMVLDDSYLNEKDYSLCLMSKVKDFATLANLKVVVANEGFDNIKFTYMGGYWVMMEFQTEVAKLKFQENSIMKTWFSHIQLASSDFNTDGRVTCVEIKGIPLKMWSKTTFNHTMTRRRIRGLVHTKKIPNGEDVKNVEDLKGDSDGEIVPDTKFEEDFPNQKGEEDSVGQGNVESEDPFNIYELLNHKRPVIDNNSNSKESLKYPPGYNPTGSKEATGEKQFDMKKKSKNDVEESICSGHFKKSEVLGWLCITVDRRLGESVGNYAMLWDYLSLVMSKWKGEVVIMGDFNEVRNKSERFRTLFNRHGADVFNHFISNAGLKEVPLEGCSFTWCHRSATKMSKLDRFLISDSLLCSCWYISSITLDRRTEVVKLLQEVEKNNSLEAAQKEKIKWAIEGDENSKYYHGGLMNEIQSTFVADIQILDGPFILNELVQWCKKKKKQSLIFKVDFEKAYDSADDAIFMGQWSESNIDTMVKVLDCFNRASGLRINMTKRSKVGGCMSRIQSWNETIERMACRLSKWKLKILSIGGRLTLLKSVLGSMPIYHMSLFKVPKKVLHRMKSIRSHFFNGAELSSKKSSSIFKWVWRFITQGSSLWARVIKALHGYDGKIGQKVKSCYPLLWLDIIHEVELFKSRGIDLVSLIHSKLGNGANKSFWEVAWREGSPFKSLFPRLYALETQKKIDVASNLSHSCLDVSFRRPPRGGVEIQQFEHMNEKVEGCILADIMDRWFWALEGSGEFTITSVRKMIDDFMLPEVSSKTC
nr:RNA-directed DNA polymerase, eukaryota, reverse transcriptase zinc-binding domain protein [Tanacetum cinerariifolium]